MLTPEQRAGFEELGIVRWPRAISGAEAEKMRDRVWGALADRQILREKPETWTALRPSGFQQLERSGAFASIGSPAVREVLDELLGEAGWEEPRCWGQLLVSFPDGQPWRLPARTWHLDMPVSASFERLPGVQIFAFLDRVGPGGGGTLVVTGRHLLVQRLARSAPEGGLRSSAARRALERSEPWFRALWSSGEPADRERRLMHETAEIAGASVRVVELTGAPGDVALMHPWVVHASAPNGDTAPRIMVTQRLTAAPAQRNFPTTRRRGVRRGGREVQR